MQQVTDLAMDVLRELRDSLADTFGLFRGSGWGAGSAWTELVTRLIVAALIVALFALAYRLLRRGLRLVLARTALPEEAGGAALLALRYTVGLLAVLAVLGQFGMRRELLADLAFGALFAFAFYTLWVVANHVLTDGVRRRGLDRSLEQLLRNLLAVVVGVLAVITVLDQFAIDVLGVVTALGVVGIAVGFAAQETLANFIAGVTLLIERPFRIGDWVEISGRVGRVARINLRTTRLVDRNNVLMSIPNSSVASADIVNLTAGGPLRVEIPIGIAYKESAKRAREVMLPAVLEHPKVLTTPAREPAVLVGALGDSSVDLRLLYWISPHDIATQPRISAEILERCKEELDAAGIEIPFPHLQLFVDEAKGLRPVLQPLYERLGRGPM